MRPSTGTCCRLRKQSTLRAVPCRKEGACCSNANERSIAYGCAKAFTRAGRQIAVTYLNDKAKTSVRPLAEK